MSVVAATGQLTRDEHVAELRAALQWCIAGADAGDGIVTCTGLDDDTLAALYRYAFADRSPAALARVHAAFSRRIGPLIG
ncbi:MAG: hypothetical protein PGN27_04055 [Mycolicibacterium neoaurum]|uniref:hypothetical protein n=1 Tax=Mycolicibacterium neoaurum TaxID=1795 RepID=UPI002FF634C6